MYNVCCYLLQLSDVSTYYTASGPVEGLTATITDTSGSFKISISWSAPLEPNGIIKLYNYTVTNTVTSLEVALGSELSTSVGDVSLSGAEAYTNYTVSVFAVNSAGAGEDSIITLLSPETGERDIVILQWNFSLYEDTCELRIPL